MSYSVFFYFYLNAAVSIYYSVNYILLIIPFNHTIYYYNQRMNLLYTHRYGQPPADIIQELAPDLELDDDGMPRIPAFHDGMPDMSNMNEECIMM